MKPLELPHEIERLRAVADGTAYNEPTYRCPRCRDTGFVLRTDDLGRPWGGRCSCLQDEIAAHQARQTTPRGRGKARPGSDLPF